ncbi:proline dehydrogenase family protein [Solicola gregarius]|uniref:proline dehydrogenase n=1 Tax=Solicola gregarius TaxID=2908642 RepID=A0AA46TM43_9ACTN|nr:proline dehydrogenase family protein [Solicola gregarius]UYM07839.1 proline dehydrogenase family protein [Solicola gregarius]
MLRRSLLALSRSDRVKGLVATMPVSSGIVARYVAGESTEDAVRTVGTLADGGLLASLDHLGEDCHDRTQADANVDAYLKLIDALTVSRETGRAEVSVKLSAIGQALGRDGERVAIDNARRICRGADDARTTVTLDMEDHTTTDSTLTILRELRTDFPATGAVVQAYLHRTEQDCRDLAYEGSRVRLCKGAYKEPASVAFQRRMDVDRSYVRCAMVLMAGAGYPMIATHDPRLIDISMMLAKRNGRSTEEFELQMLYGMRPDEQRRLAELGHRMRVYVPYGSQWYGYLMRRLAERPSNVTFFARSLLTKS